MKLPTCSSSSSQGLRVATRSGFTLAEAMVASAIALLVAGGAMMFLNFGSTSLSGITAQTRLVQEGGNTIELIQSRIRLATSITNDSAGNTLTLGLDDNVTSDSNGDGTTWNDRDHFEQFQFLGVNSTNSAACSGNSLVYIPNTKFTNTQVLIPKGVRNLPGYKIFTATNFSTCVIIRFGVVDTYALDRYQAIDIQGTGVAMNSPVVTNFISILP